MHRLLLLFAGTGVLLYLLACLGLYLQQRALLYFPVAAARTDPAHRETLRVPDATLQLAVQHHDGDEALIYFGGNREDVSQTLSDYAAAFPGRAIYMLHYRGYGGSSGEPSEAALHADALALYQRVRQQHARITVIGRSLGSGVAIRLAAQRPVEQLVLVTPYDSVLNVAQEQYPWVPVSLLLHDTFESWRVAPQISAPTLLIAAGNDRLIPPEHARALLAAFRPGVARLMILPQAEHNLRNVLPEYFRLLVQTLPLR
ncbi:alpha/beta hydrolase [Chitinilyticum litopenaei]|uniref:Alpha/beta hydrolase n=1 Tax=Chitinilyticum piscinae TaxID=2866724 RepID=A0A8J7FLJ2_9NEIS|nr:alpha/beta hydrolase [Chitinilyticum piscinae]